MSGDRMSQAWDWLSTYPIHPHPELGRDGVVCPYMVKAIRRKYVTMTEFDANEGDLAFMALARKLRDGVLERAAEFGSDRLYLVGMAVPYGLGEAELKAMVERVHTALKPEFVELGLMIGDFWPEHETIGLHNDDFRPFTSPIPLLGMRHITPADLPFFVKHEPVPAERLRLLAIFRRLFDGRLNAYWSQRLVEAENEAGQELARSRVAA